MTGDPAPDSRGPHGEEALNALVASASRGQPEALAQLFSALYDELHRKAQRAMGGQRPDHTLQTTALVNEVYLRLSRSPAGVYHDRGHFLMVASGVMRHILIDHHRRTASGSRPQGRVDLDLTELIGPFQERAVDLEALDELLMELAAEDPEAARIVELRFFGGVSLAEIGELLDIGTRTVGRRWEAIRLWLHSRLR